MFQMSLRYRIISLVSLFAAILIASFSILLVTRQLQVTTENNLFRARVGTFAAKGGFERALLSSTRTGEPEKAFQKMIPILQQGQLAEQVDVADLRGRVVASSMNESQSLFLPEEEKDWASQSARNYNPQNWFIPRISPTEVVLYAPITVDDIPKYVAVFHYSLGNMSDAIRESMTTCLITAAAVVVVVIPLALLLINVILRPIQELNRATKDITGGNLTMKVTVATEDELGELAETFNEMTNAFVQMKEKAENSNPLTRLPGNNSIHAEIEHRLKENQKFVAIYGDLDNFKAFNDIYGINAGDQAIKLTAKILRESLKIGAPNDFLGHEGGDDFMLVTTPEKAETVTRYICTEFDRRIRELYTEEDRKRGYLLSKDREGNEKQFPIMTISLAGATNQERKLTSYAEVTNICAEVKKAAKNRSRASGKSSYYLDRRTSSDDKRAPVEGPPKAQA